MVRSGEDEPPLRPRDLPAEFPCGLDPLPDDHLHVLKCLLVGTAVRGTTWQLRNLSDERFVFSAPVDDDLIPDHWSALQAFPGTSDGDGSQRCEDLGKRNDASLRALRSAGRRTGGATGTRCRPAPPARW